MKRGALLLAVLGSGCLDFPHAVSEYCSKAHEPRPPQCTKTMARVDAGNGTDLLAEPRDGGALAWGHRWGEASLDEEPTAIAETPGGDVLLGGHNGDAGLFITRWTRGGVLIETRLAPGAADLGGLAVDDAGVLFVSGTLRGSLALPGGPFDAGTQASTGFLARYEADGGLSGWLQLGSADGGGSSRLGRIALSGDRLAAVGAYDGELVVNGASIGAREGEGGMLLVLDTATLQLQAHALAKKNCFVSRLDDLAIDQAGRARVFAAIAGRPGVCELGAGMGPTQSDPVPWTGAFSTTGTGEQSANEITSQVALATPHPVRGAIAGLGWAAGYTASGGFTVFSSRSDLITTSAQESELSTIASSPSRAYVAFSYRSVTNPLLSGVSSGITFPARAQLSPVVFPLALGATSIPWMRVFEAEGAAAYARVSLVTSDGALIVAGSFSDGLGTETQLLRSSGGSDVFILELDTRP